MLVCLEMPEYNAVVQWNLFVEAGYNRGVDIYLGIQDLSGYVQDYYFVPIAWVIYAYA